MCKHKRGVRLLVTFLAMLLTFSPIALAQLKAAPRTAEPVQWQSSFLRNGLFQTEAAGFPENYTFRVVTANTLQNAVNTASLTKELFHAIKESGRTVILVDNCAAYSIRPDDVADIAPETFSQVVQLGSYYRTGTSYPPAARDIAKKYQAIIHDDQYCMGRDFSFWQITAFPAEVLRSCTVRLAVTNAGRADSGASLGSAAAIAENFAEAARAGNLHAYPYQRLDISVLADVKPTAGDDNIVSITVNATGTWMFSTVSMMPSETDKTAAGAVASIISALPALVSGANAQAVADARDAYDKLTLSGRALVPNDYVLFAAEVELGIAGLPQIIAASNAAAILAARQRYDGLTRRAKQEVDNLDRLENAERDLEAIRHTIRIACVGDSITRGALASNPDTRRYPAQLQSILGAEFAGKNFGVGGSTLLEKGDKPYWDQPAFLESSAFSPDIVIIMLGTNDAKPKNWIYKTGYTADMTALVNHYRALESSPVVYIATSPAVYTNTLSITDAVVSGELTVMQKEIAASLDCPILDVNAATREHEEWFADGIHPNDDGYRAIAEVMATAGLEHRDATLSDIRLDGVELESFDSAIMEYTVSLDKDASLPYVTGTISVGGAKLTVVQPSPETLKASLKVVARDGWTEQFYTVQFRYPDIPPSSSNESGTGNADDQETPTTQKPISGKTEDPSVQTGEPFPWGAVLGAVGAAGLLPALRKRRFHKESSC